jgi:D-alanyl-D-alanine dipeptidase
MQDEGQGMNKKLGIFLVILFLILCIILIMKLEEDREHQSAPTQTIHTSSPYATSTETPEPTLEPTLSPTPTPEATPEPRLPEGFVYVKDVIPYIHLDVRYYTDKNFIGSRIDGYNAPVAILTVEAAEALKKACEIFYQKGYIVTIYDAYRPQKAVEHFVRWSEDESDTRMKEIYYPNLHKSYLIGNFISSKSGHSRGSTVDMSLLDLEGKEVDMGGYFDLFDSLSYYENSKITDIQRENRKLLREVMVECGFIPSNGEWWHFRLDNEPYPDTYFDFDVE